VAVAFADFLSTAGFEFTDRGDFSTERREFCNGDGDSDADLVTGLLTLLTFGVAGGALLELSDGFDLSKFIISTISDQQTIKSDTIQFPIK